MLELLLIQASAAGDGFVGAFGIGVVSLPAFTVGVSAVPTPITEVEWEGWMWHQFFSLHSTAAFDAGGPNRVQIPIDTKAMRKLGTEEVVYLAYEGTEDTTAQLQILSDSRMLVKLP